MVSSNWKEDNLLSLINKLRNYNSNISYFLILSIPSAKQFFVLFKKSSPSVEASTDGEASFTLMVRTLFKSNKKGNRPRLYDVVAVL